MVYSGLFCFPGDCQFPADVVPFFHMWHCHRKGERKHGANHRASRPGISRQARAPPRRWWSFWTRATPCPSSPATARSATAPWTTRPSWARWRTVWPTCGAWSSGRSEVRGGHPGAGQAHRGAAPPPSSDAADSLAEVEDLYRPYRQKRRTRATMAREKGLEPLAASCSWRGRTPRAAPCGKPAWSWPPPMSDPEKGVETRGGRPPGRLRTSWPRASSDDAAIRKRAAGPCSRKAGVPAARWPPRRRTRVYSLYYDFCRAGSPGSRATRCWPSTGGRRRASSRWPFELDREGTSPLPTASSGTCSPRHPYCAAAGAGGPGQPGDRLIFPSLEREIRGDLTDMADEGAIHTFALNLQPPADAAPGEGPGRAWAWTPATAPAARWRWWTAPARCWTPPSSTPPSRHKQGGGGHRQPCAALIRRHGVQLHRHRQRHRQPGDRAD